MNPCTASKAKGRPCIFTESGRCLWCGRTEADPPKPTHCALCGNELCSRHELGRIADAAIDALNATQPATLLQGGAAGVDAAALGGNLAVLGFELLRLSALLRLCRRCSERELQSAATARLKRIRKVSA